MLIDESRLLGFNNWVQESSLFRKLGKFKTKQVNQKFHIIPVNKTRTNQTNPMKSSSIYKCKLFPIIHGFKTMFSK